MEACGAGETCFLIHIDMLHESPMCMGITNDPANYGPDKNVYWAYDGGHGHLLRFDFERDHGPGSMDHTVADIKRFSAIKLSPVEGVPSHMVLDAETRLLYIADTGNNRVLKVDVDGLQASKAYEKVRDAKELFRIFSSDEPTFKYDIYDGPYYEVFAGVELPSGIALHEGVLVVGEHGSGKIKAFNTTTGGLIQVVHTELTNALFGLAFSPSGQLWYVDGKDNELVRVVVTASCSSLQTQSHCHDGQQNQDETDVDCGGEACPRCEQGASCSSNPDCIFGYCKLGVCQDEFDSPERNSAIDAGFLFEHYESTWHRMTFMYNGILGGMHTNLSDMPAGYFNPYPIMDANFCEMVGTSNFTQPLNCSNVDFDSLLLGGCYCHQCLEELPQLQSCSNGGTCLRHLNQGYTCECNSPFSGDHCQMQDGELTGPWHLMLPIEATTTESAATDDVVEVSGSGSSPASSFNGRLHTILAATIVCVLTHLL